MTKYDESFYLCEGIWLDIKEKKIIDKHNKDENGNNKDLKIHENREDQIRVFEQEVKEWIIHPIYTLINEDVFENEKLNFNKYLPFKNAIFILFGVFSYIEKIQRYKEGIPPKGTNDKESTDFLINGIRRLFPKITEFEEYNKIVHNIRNSLMHSGMIHDDVYLNYNSSEYTEALTITKEGKIKISPLHLIKEIEDDFESYLKDLRDANNKVQRDNFKKVFLKFYEKEKEFLKQT